VAAIISPGVQGGMLLVLLVLVVKEEVFTSQEELEGREVVLVAHQDLPAMYYLQ